MEKIIEVDRPDDGADEEADAAVEWRTLAVDAAGHGQRLDRWLAMALDGLSRSHLQQLVMQGAVQVDGATVTKCARRLRAGETVAVELRPTPQAQAYAPQPMGLPVVYEDEHLLVLDKPAGLVVHPGAGHWSGTLLNGLLAHHAGAAALPRAGIVHRLDKDTSGLMVVAKSARAYEGLVAAIAARRVRRIYVALAQGAWSGAAERRVEAPIGRDPRQRLRMAVHPSGSPAARVARTDVRVLDRAAAATLIGCRLHTGRTHQIRVHLASQGHPIAGDDKYGDFERNKSLQKQGLRRMFLHAWRLQFVHPATAQAVELLAPLPADLLSFSKQPPPSA